jgi:membrane-associated HD superfamily phosphohydrolase
MKIEWSPWQRYAALAIVASALAGVGSAGFDRSNPSYRVGEFTEGSIRAPYDFVVTDTDATERQRTEAARRSPVVVEVDAGAAAALQATIGGALAPLFDAVAGIGPAPEALPDTSSVRTQRAAEASARQRQRAFDAAISAASPEIERAIGAPVPPELRELLIEENGLSRLRNLAGSIVEEAYARPVVGDVAAVWSAVSAELQPETFGVWLVTASGERLVQQPGALDPLDIARASVREASSSQAGIPMPVDRWLRRAVATTLQPNAAVNVEATQVRRAATAAGVIPVSLSFRRNQLVIGEGQPVTPQTILALDYLRAQRSEQ